MEKEGKIMSEEKRNLTEEERKELKEKLKKQVDEMSDEELDKVAGGLVEYEKCQVHNIYYNKYWGCPKCNPDMFKCKYCGTTFSGDYALMQHLFKCPDRPDDGGTTIS